MTARGMRCNTDGVTNSEYSNVGAYVDLATTNRVQMNSEDCIATAWVRIEGAHGAATSWGHDPFYLLGLSGNNIGMVFHFGKLDDASPFSATIHSAYRDSSGSGEILMTESARVAAQSTNYFCAMIWDAAAHTMTQLIAADGDTSFTSNTTSSITISSGEYVDRLYVGNRAAVCNHTITNEKFWKGSGIASSFTATSYAGLLAEMKSEAPVITSNLLAHYKLLTHTDLTDYGARGLNLTAAGTTTDGTMDPVDIQAAVSTRKVLVIS